MLQVDILDPTDVDKVVPAFHRDGFVCVANPLTKEQFALNKQGAEQIMQEQEEEYGAEKMNRGYARHSFGNQTHHWEWCILIDLPTILPIIDAIWQNNDYTCWGAGGDYSLPGAKIQHLHADISKDFFQDPLNQVTIRDIPTPNIVVNFTIVDFTVANGAIRFIPGTQRSRAPVPMLENEPDWMRNNHLCAPANTAIIRDIRCWHGGTANDSDHKRPMTSVAYHAPWHRAKTEKILPRAHYERLSERGQRLCCHIVQD